MFNVLITKAVNAAPADDVYGEGLAALGVGDPDISDLDLGGILLSKSDGLIVQRDAAGNIADSVGFEHGDTFKFVVKTANGLQKGLTINPFEAKYSYQAYVAPVAKTATHVLSAPADLTPYVGQYATLRIIDNSKPEFRVNRNKAYEVVLTDVNSADIDLVAAALVAKINADATCPVTAAYDGATDTITYTAKAAGKNFTVIAEDVIRESTYAVTQVVVTGTPTSKLAEKEIRRSSQLGINIDEMAADLYNVVRSADPDTTYDVFVITTRNNTGFAKSPTFDLTQVIAVPSGCTTLVTELTSLLDYITGADAAAAWEA